MEELILRYLGYLVITGFNFKGFGEKRKRGLLVRGAPLLSFLLLWKTTGTYLSQLAFQQGSSNSNTLLQHGTDVIGFSPFYLNQLTKNCHVH